MIQNKPPTLCNYTDKETTNKKVHGTDPNGIPFHKSSLNVKFTFVHHISLPGKTIGDKLPKT